MKKLLSIATVILCFSLLCGANISQAQPALTVGIDTNLQPFSYKNSSGEYVGFDIDIWQAIAHKLGLAYEFRPMEFDKILPALQNGTLGAAIAAITINAQREQIVDFSYPYFDSGLSIMVTAERQNIYGIGALEDKIIATKRGTTSATFVSNILKKDVLLSNDIETAYQAVLTGTADAAIYDAPALLYFIRTQGQDKLKSVGPRYQKQSYGIAFPQNSPLREQVSVALLQIIESGEYDTISRKWFGYTD
ncbi:MAG: transporter substrate-binding domain-containing protein [Desulfuromonas sp.]|nr:transporter substrate-binding domain-containing protein [Desulfuromonas sp.]